MSLPKALHRLEGLLIGGAAVAGYFWLGQPGWMFVALILVPDVGMVGYLVNTKIGSWTYNLMHFYGWPVLLGLFGWVSENTAMIGIGLIWISHIGIDRLLGLGLKYPSSFQDVDLARL